MLLRKLCGEHTIDVDLLPEAPLVLDVGCRFYNFCEEIFALRPQAKIVALDPATDVPPPSDPRIQFLHSALVEGERAWVQPEGWVAKTAPQDGWLEVPVISIRKLLARWPYFDLIKFDCEGSEFKILENWPGPCATQINIEFHDNLYSEDGKGLPQSYYDRLFGKMTDYRVIQNEPDEWGTHFDALLVLASPV